uniref:TmcB/TmcC TPR repeats domain-containing protein n=1 Tax=Davidia involucrata TaxID=16924 RepID=A0A5B7AIJ1_DAVIN
MKAVLLRTGSVPVQHSFVPGSPRVSFSVHDSLAAKLSGDRNKAVSPRISLHLEASRRNEIPPTRSIRRASSESDMIRSESEVSGGFSRLSGAGSRSFPARIPEEGYLSEVKEDVVGGVGSLFFTERSCDRNYARDWPESGIPVEELGFSGGGIGKGSKIGGGGSGDDFGIGTFTGGNADRKKIGAYYEEMLKSNPTDSLLLRNYGKFLHEVERDTVKAEEYYGRAILASPGDGEMLSLYGKLIWETQRDEDRAKSYFDQAVHASPNDSTVLGSYAHFMWEAEEEELQGEEELSPAMVEAF